MNAINARLAGYSGLATGLAAGGQNALSYYGSLRQPASTGTFSSGGSYAYPTVSSYYGSGYTPKYGGR